MNRLLRMYPAAWRERYGDEFSALLDDVQLSPFDVIDIVLGALDAHLRPQRTTGGGEQRKEYLMTRRQYGYAAQVGGVLWLITFVAGSLLPMPIREVAFILFPAAAVALLLALAGLSAVPARRRSGRAWLAFLAPASGLLISLGGIVLMALSPGRPLLGDVQGYYVWMAGLLGLLLGSTVFAVDALAAGAFPRAPVTTLGLSGAVAGLVGIALLLTPWTPAGPSLPLGLTAIASLVLYGGAWVRLGNFAARQAPLARPASS